MSDILIRQGSEEDMKTLRHDREVIASGHIITYCHDHLTTPKGHEDVYDMILHPGAAAVLPVLDDGRIVMVRQYRNAIDRFTLEIPAGGLDHEGEPAKEAALRELREECGLEAGEVAFLLSVCPVVAYGNEKIDIFAARSLRKTDRDLDEDEAINVEAWSIDELANLIYSGKLNDAKTCAAVMAYSHALHSGHNIFG